jgi:hypothetical protein
MKSILIGECSNTINLFHQIHHYLKYILLPHNLIIEMAPRLQNLRYTFVEKMRAPILTHV